MTAALKDIGQSFNAPSDSYSEGDFARDALHILPLGIVPLQSEALSRTRMVKDSHLESVIEVFHGKQSGSGQIPLADVAREFGLTSKDPSGLPRPNPDMGTLRKLAKLSSFDVYSLRIALRSNDIPVNDIAALQLSEPLKKQLGGYMSEFTRPLAKAIYGPDDLAVQDFQDIVRLFRDPDMEQAKEKLKRLADTLKIKVRELPRFLEDFGDIFLALAYYKKCLADVEMTVYEILDVLVEIRKAHQFQENTRLLKSCFAMQEVLNALMSSIIGRFEHFERSTNGMWENISADRFHEVKKLVESYHLVIGGALCALTVKMDAWRTLFPNKTSSGINRKAEFIMTDLSRGIESIRRIDDEAIRGALGSNFGAAYQRPMLLTN